MTCPALWNTVGDEAIHSGVLSEIDFMYSTKQSESKDAKCNFCNGKFSKNERGEIWIKCFSCFVWEHLDCTTAVNAEYTCDFYK